MVLRRFPAFDNEAFTVDASSPRLAEGSPLINNGNTPRGTIFEYKAGFPYKTITLDDTGGDPDIFEDGQPNNHTIVDGMGLVANGQGVESESIHFFRALDDDGDPTGPTIAVTVFSQGGNFSDVWGMSADADLVPGTRYVKTGGRNLGNSEYTDFVPCFTTDTVILTSRGEVRVQDLVEGDRVLTRDNGFQELAWIGRSAQGQTALQRDARLRPIRIAAGSLGPDFPRHDLVLSPNHRVVLRNAATQMTYGSDEVLVAAKILLGRPGVEVLEVPDVTYFHLLFARHEVVLSNDTWTESFLPGQQALTGVGADQRDEVLRLFPELRSDAASAAFVAARPILNRREFLHTQ